MLVGSRPSGLPVAAITVDTRVSITKSSASSSGPRNSKSSVKPPLSVPVTFASVSTIVLRPRRSVERMSLSTIEIFVTTLPSKSGHVGPNALRSSFDVCVVRTVACSASSAVDVVVPSLP